MSCFICHRSDPIKHGTYVRVTLDGSVRDVCDDCFEKGDKAYRYAYLNETLDMTEDEDA